MKNGLLWKYVDRQFIQFLFFMLFFSLSSNAQTYSGYVSDLIVLPTPTVSGDAYIYQYQYVSQSSHLEVDSRTGLVQIRSYFIGTETVRCDYYWKRQYTIGGQTYETLGNNSTSYNIRCNAVNLTGLPRNIEMTAGDTKRLSWSRSPSNKGSGEVEWETSDWFVIEVNESGVLKAKSPGQAVITAHNNDGPEVDIYVTVKENNIPVLSADVNSGSVEKGTLVTLSCNKSNAEIYYTTDGTIPSRSSTRYTSAISIDKALTLKAKAYANGYESSVLSNIYTIKIRLSISLGGGVVDKGTIVTINSSEPEADIYYTLDGSTPKNSSNKYVDSGIAINESCTLKAIAYKTGYDTSDVLSEKYTVRMNAKGVSISLPSKTIGIDDKITANYVLLPAEATSSVTWSSDNADIASVDATTGEIMGLKAGVAYISATTDNGKTDICKIVVSGPPVFDDGTGIATFAMGNHYAFFVKKDGTLWACGRNQYGELCDGTTQERTEPIMVMKDVASVAADCTMGSQYSNGYTLILKKDGSLLGGGLNDRCQLGDGTRNHQKSGAIKVMDNVSSVATFSRRTYILKRNGDLYACGDTYNYIEVDYWTRETNHFEPQRILTNIAKLAIGKKPMAISKSGTLYGWGEYDSFGHFLTDTKKIMDNVSWATATYDYSLIVKNDSSLWTSGNNSYGQLCDGTQNNISTARKIMNDVVFASAQSTLQTNEGFSFIIKKDKSLWGCGYNRNGGLGNGTNNNQWEPIKLLENVDTIASNGYTTYFRKTDGSLWGHGSNPYGILCDGTTEKHLTPIMIMRAPDVRISFSTSSETFTVGETSTLITTFSTDTLMTVTWSSDNPAIASVDPQTGRVTAVSPGITFINATLINGRKDWCKIIVKAKAPSQIAITPSLEVKVGKTSAINYSMTPTDAQSDITWESDDSRIASVSASGEVTGVAPGTTTIHATTENGLTGSCMVTVRQNYVISLSSSGYATFYDSRQHFSLPAGLSAHVVTNAASNKLMYRKVTDNVVPKGVPVMIESDTKRAGTYTLIATESTASYNGTNLLHGSDEGTTTTGDGYHYKLSFGPSGTGWNNVFGWYWGAQDGAPFQIEGHKAWLVVPTTNGSRGYTIEGDVTGINQVEANKADGGFYDLQGRRLNAPNKSGIYIQNGRKIVIK